MSRSEGARRPRGNHIVVKIGARKYAIYGHLKPGSIHVEPGDRVRTGDVIAELGNSGNSSSPHPHFSIQDGPDVLTSNSRPFVIDRYALHGTTAFGPTMVVTGTPRLGAAHSR